MDSPYKSFLFLNQEFAPEDHIVAIYSFQTNADFLTVAGGIAAESSIGTWTFLSTQSKSTFNKYCAKVFYANPASGIIKIAYPLDLFEPGNIPQLMSGVMGNIFGLKEIKKLKLLDLELPRTYVTTFSGPQIGMDGIREITGVQNAPLLGSIVKPKEGLNSNEHAEVAMNVYRGGVNLVKDDENLTNPPFNLFHNRVQIITDKMKQENFLKKGRERIYAFNITASAETMKERADFVKHRGGNCIMLDILTAGFSGVQYIRNHHYGMIMHGHRAMHAAFTRDPEHGVTMMVLAKLARLAGIDSLHTGTIVGKMDGGAEEVLQINRFLTSEWYGLKKTLPVASGGLSPLNVPDLMSYFGNDILMNFGGGIHGHPKGTLEGAQAIVQAVEAVRAEKSLSDYAKTHEALKLAIDQWG